MQWSMCLFSSPRAFDAVDQLLRGELKFGMPASPIGSRLRRVAVSPLREGQQCEMILYEKSKNLCGREQCCLTIPAGDGRVPAVTAVPTSVTRLVKVFRVWLVLPDIHSQEQRIWCWVTPCIVPVNRGLLPWKKHPNPGLFGGDQHGVLCV